MQEEPIFDYVRRRLLALDRAEWPALSLAMFGVKSTVRKLAYEPERTPRIDRVEKLYRHFLQIDTGSRRLPHEMPKRRKD